MRFHPHLLQHLQDGFRTVGFFRGKPAYAGDAAFSRAESGEDGHDGKEVRCVAEVLPERLQRRFPYTHGPLVELGDHGTGLDEDLIDEMVRRDIALVPTLIQLETFPDIAAGSDRFPKYKANMLALHAGRRDVFAQAREAGVRIYAGTDAGGTITHGRIVDEIESLAGIGLSPLEALTAASTAPRAWLGVPGIEHGARADFLVLDADPAQDLSTLRRPTHLICGGAKVA